MSDQTRQELLIQLLKRVKSMDFETKKQLANDLYLSASELELLLVELIQERTNSGKAWTI